MKKFAKLFENGVNYALMKVLFRFFFIRNFHDYFLIKIKKNIKKNFKNDGLLILNDTLEKIILDLKSDGIYDKIKLQSKIVDNISNYAMITPSYVDDNKEMGFLIKDKKKTEGIIKKNILKSSYYNVYEECNEIKEISDSKVLLNIAESYMGTKAKRIASQLWWTFPVEANNEEKSKAALYFHRDLDDFKFIKFFFYISDVNVGDGEHSYVKTSHKTSFIQNIKEKFRVSRFLDENIINWYGQKNIHVLYGKKGSGFIEDTFGFHKGSKPLNNPRLLLCIVFALNNYGVQELTANHNELNKIE